MFAKYDKNSIINTYEVIKKFAKFRVEIPTMNSLIIM